jgi:uncharacterized RDD family membrane protein YckC
MIIKITELRETRLRTVHFRNEYGELERDTEEWEFQRPVKTVTSPRRFAHHIVDVLIIQLLVLSFEFCYKFIIQIGELYAEENNFLIMFVGLPSFLTMYVGYYAIFEYLYQKTPGKFLTHTIVINEYGSKPELSNILLRSLFRLVPFEAFSCLGDKYSYGWHDKWSKTWVVTDDELIDLQRLQVETLNNY